MTPVDHTLRSILDRESILCVKLKRKMWAPIAIAWLLLNIIAFILGGEYGEIEVKIEAPN